MKISDLRKIIYEEVQKAIREELREILSEVQVTPKTTMYQSPRYARPAVQERVEHQDDLNTVSIGSILQETLNSMTKDDYHNIMGDTVVYSSPTLSNSNSVEGSTMSDIPSFAKNAKAILDASLAKDRERNGL